MTNLPNSTGSGNLDNVGVTRAEFRAEIGVLLEYIAQALGDVTGNYTNETVNPEAVILQGTPTLESGAEPGSDDNTLRIVNSRWVKRNGRYVGGSEPAAPVNGTLWVDTTTTPYTIQAYNSTASAFQVVSGVPSGTRMLFQQTAAPTGWTKETTNFENHALRVTHGTVGSGGTNSFGDAFNSAISTGGTVAGHALTINEMPQHSHGVSDPGHNHAINDPGHSHAFTAARENNRTESGSGDVECENRNLQTASATTGITIRNKATGITIQNRGGGNAHTHAFTEGSINLDVQYVDIIIAEKD